MKKLLNEAYGWLFTITLLSLLVYFTDANSVFVGETWQETILEYGMAVCFFYGLGAAIWNGGVLIIAPLYSGYKKIAYKQQD